MEKKTISKLIGWTCKLTARAETQVNALQHGRLGEYGLLAESGSWNIIFMAPCMHEFLATTVRGIHYLRYPKCLHKHTHSFAQQQVGGQMDTDLSASIFL